ncbi:hypothetical protein GH714_033186 [Hevea brasiliensis]|uniref:Uncharacterized protein n=1 Tax=Hevea brasiliensis TaxID=3981 RepID=A0A6A6L539_HEVBR|nr:hypothetical protein GH714_033186 [Hevea brasiliensis]
MASPLPELQGGEGIILSNSAKKVESKGGLESSDKKSPILIFLYFHKAIRNELDSLHRLAMAFAQDRPSMFALSLNAIVFSCSFTSTIAMPKTSKLQESFNFCIVNGHFWFCKIVIQTAWKVGKDGVEAGTNLVPDSVPRPIARISVTVVALAISLFMLKSFLSTAFFALAMHATLVLFQFGTTSRFLEKSHGNAVMNHEAFIYNLV